MQSQGVIATRVQIATEVETGIREIMRAAKPNARRTEETAIGWQRKHVHEGTAKATNPATFGVCVAEMLTDGTPTERVLALPRFLESVIRRHREPATVDLATAFQRETEAQGSADVAQMIGVTTRSEGDLRIARERIYGHRQAADDAIRAIDAELAARAAQRRLARSQLHHLQPA